MFFSLLLVVALLCIACDMTTSVKTNSRLLVRPIKVMQSIVASSILALSLQSNVALADTADQPPVVALLTKRSADLQPYNDIGRGFKMLRPFGFNEFDGAGGGYAVKFASLINVDENVVVGSVPSAAGKTSISDYGTLDELGKKFASKRDGQVVKASSRLTEGILFYEFEFANPLDQSLPRTGPKDKRPTKQVELFEVCVYRGRLWSVKATVSCLV